MKHPLLALLLLASWLVPCAMVSAQTSSSLSAADHVALLKHATSHTPPTRHPVHYGFNVPWRYKGLVYHTFASGMYIYQTCISPSIARSCAYKPSCSNYSKALIRRYGIAKGIVCSADRIMRCNRIALADGDDHSLIDPADHRIHETVNRYSLP